MNHQEQHQGLVEEAAGGPVRGATEPDHNYNLHLLEYLEGAMQTSLQQQSTQHRRLKSAATHLSSFPFPSLSPLFCHLGLCVFIFLSV